MALLGPRSLRRGVIENSSASPPTWTDINSRRRPWETSSIFFRSVSSSSTASSRSSSGIAGSKSIAVTAEKMTLGRRLDELFPTSDFSPLARRIRQVRVLGNQAFFDPRTEESLFPFPNEQRLSKRFAEMQQKCVLTRLDRGPANEELYCLTINDMTTEMTIERLLEESNSLLAYQSRHDHLTEVHSRGYVLELLATELAKCRRYDSNLTIMLLDVDHFKAINDRHGHLCGDEVLVRLATRLRESVRETDRVGRYGGEEFIVLMPETAAHAGRVTAERCRRHIAESHSTGPDVTVSIGVAESHEPHDADTLLLRADFALYRAKNKGRNRVEADDPATVNDTFETQRSGTGA